ncbi:TniB family NTP-binding protein [Microbacterium sp. CCH5-D1]|uniref:TniB family NTP-binding protein n=1 Tax=Microbacterium sp. CCH5-D1 TaxID=1768780 RepID=UPI000769D004|nr:TniB family NTP-binding protein [Microbacterium sp. CCH5-D1]
MYELTTKEGWRERIDMILERPVMISGEELRSMSFGDRAFYNEGRARFAQAGAFVKTPLYRLFERAVRDRVMLNQFRQVGKLGVLLSGDTGNGKTTTLVEVGIAHERRRRETGHASAAPGKIPVMYVMVPSQCSAKGLMEEFARFFGLPIPGRATYGHLLDMIANAVRRCSTELILVDDIHHLDLRYRQNIEASDMLKQLSERCGGTFVYAGVDVEDTGLLSGSREGQIRKRFELHSARPFSLNSVEQRSDWGDLLLAIENSLCLLDQRPGDILAAAQELHQLTNGEIGLLGDMLQLDALHAIEDGSERLDLARYARAVERRQGARMKAK